MTQRRNEQFENWLRETDRQLRKQKQFKIAPHIPSTLRVVATGKPRQTRVVDPDTGYVFSYEICGLSLRFPSGHGFIPQADLYMNFTGCDVMAEVNRVEALRSAIQTTILTDDQCDSLVAELKTKKAQTGSRGRGG